jgi:hypothetical protein
MAPPAEEIALRCYCGEYNLAGRRSCGQPCSGAEEFLFGRMWGLLVFVMLRNEASLLVLFISRVQILPSSG